MVGTVFLIVGPSGAGKDTLLDLVRPQLSGYLFVRRFITRPAESGGENHIALSSTEFEQKIQRGDFCVYWRAHELGCGIDKAIIDAVSKGQNVIINTSRGSIEDFLQVFNQVRVIQITASKDVLRHRLLERGRETETQIEKRLCRQVTISDNKNVITVDNSGDLSSAAGHLLDALTTLELSSRSTSRRDLVFPQDNQTPP